MLLRVVAVATTLVLSAEETSVQQGICNHVNPLPFQDPDTFGDICSHLSFSWCLCSYLRYFL